MLRRLISGIAVALVLVGCASTRPDMAALNPTEDPRNAVARITLPGGGEELVSRAEFEQVRDKLFQGQAPEEQVLEFVTSRHLMLQEARAQDITADPTEVDEFVEQIRTQTCTQIPIPEAQSETDQTKLWEACSAFFGFENGAAFRRFLQEEVILTEIGERRVADSEEIHAAHILLETEEEARTARERVTTAGEDFATVARELSTEPAAKESGGDLGFFGPGAMVAPFEEAAFALQDGEISEPVQTQFGWHIIKVIERRKMEEVAPQAAAQAAETYRSQLLDTALQEGRVQYLITPAPAPTQEPPPLELPTVEVEPEGTAAPALEGLDTTPTPAP